jgi:hypothetical protein
MKLKNVLKFFNRSASKILIVGMVFALTGGMVAYAQFYRTTAPVPGFNYGYGYGFTDGYGYGYGYHGVLDADGDYGFFGDDGAVASFEVDPTRTTATVTFTSTYIADHSVDYGEDDTSENIGDYTDSDPIGENSIEITGLMCNTDYVLLVNSRDSGDNVWPSEDLEFTTDSCGGGGGGGRVSNAPSNTSQTTINIITAIQRAIAILTSAGQTVPQALYDVLHALGVTDGSNTAGQIFTQNLTIGSTGAQVMLLQKFLGVTPVDGIFGPVTQAAVVKFQKEHGITPSVGFFGPISRALANTLFHP